MATDYYYAINDQQLGPKTLEQLPSVGLRPETLVWYEGLPEWTRADALPELAPILAPPRPVAAPIPPPVIRAPVAALPRLAPVPMASLSYQQADISFTNSVATASLILGILSIPLSCFYLIGLPVGILAIVLGFVARNQIKLGKGQGMGMAKAGIICGAAPIVLLGTAFLVLVVFFIIHPKH